MPSFLRIAAPLALVLSLMGTAHADRKLSKAGDAALQSLMTTATFSDSAVGYSGEPSDNVVAFRVLLQEPAARSAFTRLVEHGSTAGQLYGLAGLYFTDRDRFDKEVTRLAGSKQSVDTQFGCSSTRVSVAALVRKPGAMRVPPGQTMLQWLKKHGSAARDISGGGFPLAFAGSDTKAPND